MPRLSGAALGGTPNAGNCLDEPFRDPTVTVFFEGNHGNTIETIDYYCNSLAKCESITILNCLTTFYCGTPAVSYVGIDVVVGVAQMYTDILVLIPDGKQALVLSETSFFYPSVLFGDYTDSMAWVYAIYIGLFNVFWHICLF